MFRHLHDRESAEKRRSRKKAGAFSQLVSEPRQRKMRVPTCSLNNERRGCSWRRFVIFVKKPFKTVPTGLVVRGKTNLWRIKSCEAD